MNINKISATANIRTLVTEIMQKCRVVNRKCYTVCTNQSDQTLVFYQ